MKLIRKTSTAEQPASETRPRVAPWKVLVVDDEPDVRRLTLLNLRDFQFEGRHLELIEAGSAAEARAQLAAHTGIAAALIDVVMETDDAGLRLVEHIRSNLGNRMIRLIIRTGQPGLAPERYVIDHYDIDDYKDKTELTVQKLYTTVRTALKGYRDLESIELNRTGLHHILDATPELYNFNREHLEDYFRGILTQIIAICKLDHTSMISTIDGMVATLDGQEISIRAGTGELDVTCGSPERRAEIIRLCAEAIAETELPRELRAGAMVVPLRVVDRIFGFIYLETRRVLSRDDQELIRIMANQCAAALENYRLHHNLAESYVQAIDMLGYAAEFKDSATGAHIHRIEEFTRRMAIELGFPPGEAADLGRASRLHDIGKVGIPDHILRKPGPLDEAEWNTIKTHTTIGDRILSASSHLGLARTIALAHHERWDGSGYPSGLSGETIPYAARVVAVVDVFDALVNLRPYKTAWAPEAAIAELRAKSGRFFEPRIVEAFARLYGNGHFDDLLRGPGASADDSAAP